MTVRTPPSWLQAEDHPAEHDRLYTASLLGSSLSASFTGGVSAVDAGHGVVSTDDLAVTANGTPNMSVNVAVGAAFIRGTQSTFQGVYNFVNDDEVNLTIAASDPTNPRRDLIIAQVRDSAYSGASDDARLVVVTGTPAASPSDPSLTAYPNALVLARVAVAASASSIVTGNITDLRTRARPWNTAWGKQARSNISTDTNLLTTVADINLATVTWVALPGRDYRITLYLPRVQQGGAFGEMTAAMYDSSNVARGDYGRKWSATAADTDIRPLHLPVLEDLASYGSVTRKFRGSTTAGNMYIYGSTNPGYVLVEDIGPS